MKTSIVGFPRVGKLRELKFASEKYFKGEIDAKELESVAKELRKEHYEAQKNAGIDYITSNDFSYYDIFLDTAVLFNIIPKRYTDLGLSELDTYFAMARGYQGEKGDVKALAMMKWFNTNYHYIVAEVEDDTEVKLAGDKLFRLFREAKEEGYNTKSVLTGPYTLLKLCRYTGNKTAADFKNAVVAAYKELIAKAEKEGITLLQFDEPALVYDMTSQDIELLKEVYEEVCKDTKDVKILIQTYFGDIRDAYETVVNLPVYAVGLDFVEGKQTDALVKKYGFPKDKVLFAGLINGKNIWRNNYKITLEKLAELEKAGINTVLSTSCSLLHVPFTLKNETKLAKEYLEHFAFAIEKLEELKELKALADSEDINNEETYINNQKLFNGTRVKENEEVKARYEAITDADYVRLPLRSERQALQKKVLNLPKFPTTTIGSFPQTKDVKANRAAYKKGNISKEEYIEFNKKKIAQCIAWQDEIGLDVLVHGEYERNDMVEYFGESLGGFLFTEKAWVQSYGTRCVKPPVIWGDVYREKPITVDWSVYAQSLTDKPVKGMLTGPVTILNWSFPREDISIEQSIAQIALAIRDEVLDLEKNGIKVIQIDEAALREKLPLRKSDWYTEYLDFAIPAFRLVHSGVKPDTQIYTYMCYI